MSIHRHNVPEARGLHNCHVAYEGKGERRGLIRPPDTVRAANQVVSGTDATSPILPTSVRTISVDTISLLATDPSDCSLSTNRTNSGIDAPV